MTRHNPLTSKLAHESVKPLKEAMYVKIAAGLEKLRVGGTFNEISVAAGLRPEQVWKRTSEMERLGFIFNTGITRQGISGRQCTVWQLTSLSSKTAPPKPVYKVIQSELFGFTEGG